MADVSVIILTYNEERHIARLIESCKPFAQDVFIVDSFSDDETLAIAESLGAHCVQHEFENQAKQFNWGLDNLPIETEWVLRMDADEYVPPELHEEIERRLPQLADDITGVFIAFRVMFLDRWIKHGGFYPTYILRLFRYGAGRYEERWMDEHIRLDRGRAIKFESDFIHDNLQTIGWWTGKHNNYATREAVDLLKERFDLVGEEEEEEISPSLLGTQAERKRWLKKKYTHMPLFVRPVIYFVYRYFLQLGILDGRPGLVWHFLQAFWYRFLVDAKFYEIVFRTDGDPQEIKDYLRDEYGIEL